MGYHFEEKFTVGNALVIKKALYSAIQEKQSFNQYQRDLLKTGFSYRRVEMLDDWHRASGAAIAHDWASGEKAVEWYDKVFMPLKTGLGRSTTQTQEFLGRAKHDEFEDMQELEKYLEYTDKLYGTFQEDYF